MSSYRQKCTMLRCVVLHFRFVALAHNYAGADTTAISPTPSIKNHRTTSHRTGWFGFGFICLATEKTLILVSRSAFFQKRVCGRNMTSAADPYAIYAFNSATISSTLLPLSSIAASSALSFSRSAFLTSRAFANDSLRLAARSSGVSLTTGSFFG